MKKTHVMLHHSLTADSGSVSWGAIRKYHVETNGWKDIGYHLGFERVGDYDEGLLGRPFDEDGAHCYQDGMNRISLGVCFVGDFDSASPPVSLLQYAARQLRSIMADLAVPADEAHVRMHRQHATYKTCPGARFPYTDFVRMLREG